MLELVLSFGPAPVDFKIPIAALLYLSPFSIFSGLTILYLPYLSLLMRSSAPRLERLIHIKHIAMIDSFILQAQRPACNIVYL